MTERAIFEAAIEITDAVKRDAFLNEACSGDAALRERLDVLLASHDKVSQFLNTPAIHPVPASGDEANSQTTMMPKSGSPQAREDDDGDSERNSGPDLGFLLPSSKPGSIGLLGHYEILQILGRGAFGVVFKAFDEKLHRMVAIKVMNPALAATSPPRKRFLREARSSAAVRHENIVAIHAVEEQPVPYLVMEYIPGKTLQQWLDEHGPLDPVDVLKFGQQIAAGLAAAHAQGLIHRDIKPANILIDTSIEARIKITDFGLARAVDDASMTQSGVIAGTPMYMAPEQARGQTLDHRADLFSLGTVLYTMASGRPPFRASNTIAVLKRVCEDTPRPVSEVIPGSPLWLDEIIAKLHAKEPDDRFQSAKEVAELLARCQSELQLHGRITAFQGSPVAPRQERRTSPDARDATDSQPTETWKGTEQREGEAPAEPRAVSDVEAMKAGSAGASPSRPSTGSQTTSILSPPRASTKRPRVIAASLLACVVLAGVVIAINLRNGSRETSDEASSTSKLKTPPDRSLTTSVTKASGWHGWPDDAPPPAIAPFDAEQAKKHQEAWAKYLDVPIEYTNSIGMKFRLIPPGEFTMGSTAAQIEEALKYDDPNDKIWHSCVKSESPQHKVILTRPIYVGVHEVTQAEYVKVSGHNPSHFSATGGGKDVLANIDAQSHPVETVSWNDAAEFCAKLSQQEKFKPFYFRSGETVTPLSGTGYRLPTEAEWEFACRSGTTTKYWLGDNDEELKTAAWILANSAGRTHAVGDLKPNPFGLFDVHGNVWEWVQDGWDQTNYAQFSVKPAVDPAGPSPVEPLRVLRGGVWFHPASPCYSSSRHAYLQAGRLHLFGFRVSLPVDAVRQALKVDRPTSPTATREKPASNKSNGWHGWSADAPPPAIAPFNAEQAKQHQQAWADYLKVPVEYTNSIGMKFRLIPPGEFLMGSTQAEIDNALKDANPGYKDWPEKIRSEGPQHKVILTQPFYLGAHEVTQSDYERVTGKNPSQYSKTGPQTNDIEKREVERIAGLDTANHPVERVSWNDAAEFCSLLSKRETLKPYYFRANETVTTLSGTGYRLPTEAEWEYACRAGTTTKFWSGATETDLSQAGWFLKNSGKRTHAVGELKPNPFGLFDMHGNVAEWVQDGWEPTYFAQFQNQPAVNPTGPQSTTSNRVGRGGYLDSYWDGASMCRSSARDYWGTTGRNLVSGFRVSLTVDAVRQTLASGNLAGDLDRDVAWWVLAGGGHGEIKADVEGVNSTFDTTEKLPNKPFAITDLYIHRKTFKAQELEKLTGLTRLTHLRFVETPIGDNLTRHIEGLTNLTYLQLNNCQLTDVGLERLQNLSKLEYLELNHQPGITDRGLAVVRGMPRLAVLSLFGTSVSDEGLQSLRELPLAHLFLDGTKVTNAGMKSMASLKSLTHLYLGWCAVSDEGLAQLQSLEKLHTLSLYKTSLTDRGLEHLSAMRSLRELHVGGTKVTADGIASLQKALPNCKIITELSPSDSPKPITDAMVPAASPWDLLDPAQIPAAERVPRQPEGLVAVLGQHRRRVWNSLLRSAAVSPDGSQYLLTTDDGLYLFDRDLKKPERVLNPFTGSSHATFLPDGRIVAFGRVLGKSQTQLQIFAKPRDGEPLKLQSSIDSEEGSATPAVSANGRWLAAFKSYAADPILWDLSGELPKQVAKFTNRGTTNRVPFCFSPDSLWFCFTAVNEDQSTVHLIDLRGDTPREAAVMKADGDEKSDAPAKGFLHAVFLADGRLATADRNGRIWFWKLNDGEPQRVGSIRAIGPDVVMFPAAKTSRVAFQAGGLPVWDLTTDPPRMLGSFSSSFVLDNLQFAAFAPNGETVFTAHLNGAVRFWNVSATGVTELDPLVPNPKHNDGNGQVKILGDFLCSSTETARVGVWRTAPNGLQPVPEVPPAHLVLGKNAKQQLLIVSEPRSDGTLLFKQEGNQWNPIRRINSPGVRAAALNDDGRRIAIGRNNGTEKVVELWGWESEKQPARKLAEVSGLNDWPVQLAFAEEGRTLVGRFSNHAVEVWNVGDDQLVPRAKLPPRQFIQIAVSPDGRTLATASSASNPSGLELWNLTSDLQKPTASFSMIGATAVAFSPDGQRLTAPFWESGTSAGVQIINLATGIVEKRLSFPGRVDQLDFTDDNRHLITANANGTIYVVRLVERKPLNAAKTSAADLAKWMKQVASRSADGQVVEVVKKLRELNPEFDGEFSHKVEKGAVTELRITNAHILDISPIRALTELKSLRLAGSTNPNQIGQLIDLSTLAGMKLTSLDCSFTRVKDLSPLKGMKLTKLHCGNTDVDDLSPLAGMPLTELDFGYTKVSDLSPLKGMPLTKLAFYSTPITDLSDLRGLPLTELVFFHNTRVTDLSPLEGMKLTVLDCFTTGVTDLSPLKGMPLTFLQCANTKVSDLSPLEGMPLTGLFCFSTQVEDLSPLKGMPLTSLMCERTRVNDDALKHLRELTKLETLNLTDTKVSAAGIASLRKALPNCKIATEFTSPTSPKPTTVTTAPATSPWDLLNAAQIPAAERVPEQPKELVAVLGEHRQRHAGGGNGVASISIRPDGKQFVTIGRDGLRFWDATTFQQTSHFPPKGSARLSAAYMSQGKQLVVGSEDFGNVGQIWNLDEKGISNDPPVSLPAGSGAGYTNLMVVSPDEKWLIRRTMPHSGKFHLGLIALAGSSPKIVADYPGCQFAAFSPDSRLMAILREDDKTIRILELGEGDPIERHVLKTEPEAKDDRPSKGFQQLVFLADGRLATADNNGRTWFWNLKGDQPQILFSTKRADQFLHAATQAPIVVTAESGVSSILRIDADQAVLQHHATWTEYGRPESNLTSFAIFPDGRTAITGHLHGAIRFWDITGEKAVEKHPIALQPSASPYLDLAMFPGVIVTRDEQNSLRLWKPTAEGIVEHSATRTDEPQKYLPVTTSRDGSLLVTIWGGPGCTLWQWNGETLSQRLSVGREGSWSGALSSDNQRLAIGYRGTVDLWDITARPPRLEKTLKATDPNAAAYQTAFTKDDTLLIASMNNQKTVWNLTQDQPLPEKLFANREPFLFAVSPTRDLLAVDGGGTQLLSVQQFPPQPILTLKSAPGQNGALAFSSDGKQLAVTDDLSVDRSIIDIHDTETGVRKHRITLPMPLRRLAFTEDNRHLVTVNANGTIYVLRLEAKPPSK